AERADAMARRLSRRPAHDAAVCHRQDRDRLLSGTGHDNFGIWRRRLRGRLDHVDLLLGTDLLFRRCLHPGVLGPIRQRSTDRPRQRGRARIALPTSMKQTAQKSSAMMPRSPSRPISASPKAVMATPAAVAAKGSSSKGGMVTATNTQAVATTCTPALSATHTSRWRNTLSTTRATGRRKARLRLNILQEIPRFRIQPGNQK